MCAFMALLWFDALSGYEYAMRVDEDVCVERLPVDLVAHLSRADWDYAYGVELAEAHAETLDTFLPWLRGHMAGGAPKIPPLPTQRIYFTNFFVSRVGWWARAEVRSFLQAVNLTGGIYAHRWGDAPIQTAALRLFGDRERVVGLDMDYWHLSTSNVSNGPHLQNVPPDHQP